MYTSVSKLVNTYNRFRHVSANYMAISGGRKYKDEIH